MRLGVSQGGVVSFVGIVTPPYRFRTDGSVAQLDRATAF